MVCDESTKCTEHPVAQPVGGNDEDDFLAYSCQWITVLCTFIPQDFILIAKLRRLKRENTRSVASAAVPVMCDHIPVRLFIFRIEQVLFFFTTPVAMLGELQSWDAGHDAIDAFEQWLSSKSVLGSVLVGYLPSLILLGITAILPHVIYCMFYCHSALLVVACWFAVVLLE